MLNCNGIQSELVKYVKTEKVTVAESKGFHVHSLVD